MARLQDRVHERSDVATSLRNLIESGCTEGARHDVVWSLDRCGAVTLEREQPAPATPPLADELAGREWDAVEACPDCYEFELTVREI